jgi:hypothetical protein
MKSTNLWKATLVASLVSIAGFSATIYFQIDTLANMRAVYGPLQEQLEAESRARTDDWNERNKRSAALAVEFSGDEPVEVVRLVDGGAIVRNVEGRETFALVDAEQPPSVGDFRYLGPNPEGFVLGGPIE